MALHFYHTQKILLLDTLVISIYIAKKFEITEFGFFSYFIVQKSQTHVIRCSMNEYHDALLVCYKEGTGYQYI